MNTNENVQEVIGECYTCGEVRVLEYTDYCEVCV